MSFQYAEADSWTGFVHTGFINSIDMDTLHVGESPDAIVITLSHYVCNVNWFEGNSWNV